MSSLPLRDEVERFLCIHRKCPLKVEKIWLHNDVWHVTNGASGDSIRVRAWDLGSIAHKARAIENPCLDKRATSATFHDVATVLCNTGFAQTTAHEHERFTTALSNTTDIERDVNLFTERLLHIHSMLSDSNVTQILCAAMSWPNGHPFELVNAKIAYSVTRMSMCRTLASFPILRRYESASSSQVYAKIEQLLSRNPLQVDTGLMKMAYTAHSNSKMRFLSDMVMRSRQRNLAHISIGLCALDLPVLVVLEIYNATIKHRSPLIYAAKWEIAKLVKHFND